MSFGRGSSKASAGARQGVLDPRLGRWLLLGTAMVQAASPLLIDFGAAGTDPPVVPAGYAFSIWSVILVGCVAAAVYGLPTRRAETPAYRAVHLRLSLVQLLFVAWLRAATSTAVWLTLPIFVGMLVLTLAALREVLATFTTRRDRGSRWFLGTTLGIYAGWATAAVWINAATLLADAGVEASGLIGTVWQSMILSAAATSAVLLLRRLHGSLPYVGAVGWAFTAIVVSTSMAHAPALTAVASLGLLAVGAASVVARRNRVTGGRHEGPGRVSG
ncbi:hypothetical protein SAMN04488543_1880 [Friedmanniella luteola]|uniref:TspO and MBR related proteins n=1 Tax=Friedmanniella luteola TaxID=546871 RepID=A0A1H1SV97_9ACTN|nr:hypothetical protein [Friedmanniella luteola]SDS51778.1 hypothetical protein SAMN04488543_1880 [Friedmanniella luteola]